MPIPYIKTLRTQDAHYPRTPLNSTVYPSDRLDLVLTVYESRLLDSVDSAHNDLHNKEIINLIFVHGTGMCKEVWNYHIDKLFRGNDKKDRKWILGTAVAIDAVNHGDSYLLNKNKVGWCYNWLDGGKDISRVVKKLNLKGRTLSIGHSMGGYQVLTSAFLDPLLYDSVISIEPVIYAKHDEKYKKQLLGLFLALERTIQDEFISDEAYNDWFQSGFFKNAHPKVLDDLKEAEQIEIKYKTQTNAKFKTRTSKKQQLVTYMGVPDCIDDGFSLLPLIRVPVLHVIGSKATWNPPESAEKIRSQLKHCTPLDIEGGEHLVNIEKPDEIINAIENFVDQRLSEDPNKVSVRLGDIAKTADSVVIRSKLQEAGYITIINNLKQEVKTISSSKL